MKKLLTVLACLTLFSATATASAEPKDGMMQGQMPNKAMKMDQAGTMPPMCPMMGDKPMPMKNPMYDSMHSMVDIIKMQQKIIKGVGPSEKKAILKEIDKKIDQMENMKAYMPCVQPPPSGHDHEHMPMGK